MLRVTHHLYAGEWQPCEGAETYIPIGKILECTFHVLLDKPVHGPVIKLPCYEITTHQKHLLVHESETDRMVRIIHGDEGALANFVDELRNHPLLGVYPNAVRMEWEGKQ